MIFGLLLEVVLAQNAFLSGCPVRDRRTMPSRSFPYETWRMEQTERNISQPVPGSNSIALRKKRGNFAFTLPAAQTH